MWAHSLEGMGWEGLIPKLKMCASVCTIYGQNVLYNI